MAPKWLIPWLLPLLMVIAVLALALSVALGLAILGILLCGVLPYLRYRSLKRDPPEPELRRKNFWDLR